MPARIAELWFGGCRQSRYRTYEFISVGVLDGKHAAWDWLGFN